MAAYGKDPTHLNRVTPYGGSMSQRAKHIAASNNEASERRKTSGGSIYWKDTFKCPTTYSRIVRLIPGIYEQEYSEDGETVLKAAFEYYMYIEHYHAASGRGAICSAGPLYRSKKYAKPCEGCTMFWQDFAVRREKKARGDRTRGPNRMSLSPKYAFTTWDYGPWANVPRTDQAGNFQINPNTNQPYFDWIMVPPNDPRIHQYEHRYGSLVAWPMPEMHKKTLLSYNDITIQRDCATCGNVGTIQVTSVVCGNPVCRAEIFDPRNTTLSPEQQDSIINRPQTCPRCGQTYFVTEAIECIACTPHGLTPQRASVFDVDLEVIAVATQGQLTNLQIVSRSNPRPIQISDPSVIKPLDMAAKFTPTPLGKQRELWGLQAPNPGAQTGHAPTMLPGGMQGPQQGSPVTYGMPPAAGWPSNAAMGVPMGAAPMAVAGGPPTAPPNTFMQAAPMPPPMPTGNQPPQTVELIGGMPLGAFMQPQPQVQQTPPVPPAPPPPVLGGLSMPFLPGIPMPGIPGNK